MPKIHNIWVGPPKTQDLNHVGQDLFGLLGDRQVFSHMTQTYQQGSLPTKVEPMSLLDYVKLYPQCTLHFWCLEQHIEHYRSLLQVYPNIHMQSCESLFQLDVADKWLHSRLRFIFKICATASIVRFWVLAKDIFAYVLLFYLGGYFFDTTVSPTTRTILPEPRQFKAMKDMGVTAEAGVEYCEEYFKGKARLILSDDADDKQEFSIVDLYVMASIAFDSRLKGLLENVSASFMRIMLSDELSANKTAYEKHQRFYRGITGQPLRTASFYNTDGSFSPQPAFPCNSLKWFAFSYAGRVCKVSLVATAQLNLVKIFCGTHLPNNDLIGEKQFDAEISRIQTELRGLDTCWSQDVNLLDPWPRPRLTLAVQ